MNLRVLATVALLCLLPAAEAHAVDPNPEGHLDLAIGAGESPDFIDEWVHTSYKHHVQVPRIRDLRRGKEVHIAFILSGVSRGPDGRSHVGVGVRVRDPRHRVAFSDDRFARVCRIASGRAGFTLADPTLIFSLEPDDPIGPWVVEATARDSVSGATATAKDTIVARW